jgi:hypothetical protein
LLALKIDESIGVKYDCNFWKNFYSDLRPSINHDQHRYFFQLIALNSQLGLAGVEKFDEITRVIEEKIVAYDIWLAITTEDCMRATEWIKCILLEKISVWIPLQGILIFALMVEKKKFLALFFYTIHLLQIYRQIRILSLLKHPSFIYSRKITNLFNVLRPSF